VSKPIRVIQYGLGAIGSAAAQLGLTKQNMKLVGAVDHDPKYVGAPNPRDEIHIEGEPPLHVVIQGGTAGDVATPAILVNMIPRLVEAKPGLHTMRTLGLPHFAS
jgi:hypothetical protein